MTFDYEKISDEYGQLHEDTCELNDENGSFDGCTCAVKTMVEEILAHQHKQDMARVMDVLPKEKHYRTMYSQESKGFEREDFAAGFNAALSEMRQAIIRLSESHE